MGTMFVFFLTPVYGFSERHPLLQTYLLLHFLLAGCLFWWPMVGKDLLPRRFGFGTRFVLVFLSVPFNAVLGLVIAGVGRPLYPAGNTLADTQSGGNVLWGLLEVFTVAALALLFVQWAREEERKAVRVDRQLDAALAVARTSVRRPRRAPGPLRPVQNPGRKVRDPAPAMRERLFPARPPVRPGRLHYEARLGDGSDFVQAGPGPDRQPSHGNQPRGGGFELG